MRSLSLKKVFSNIFLVFFFLLMAGCGGPPVWLVKKNTVSGLEVYADNLSYSNIYIAVDGKKVEGSDLSSAKNIKYYLDGFHNDGLRENSTVFPISSGSTMSIHFEGIGGFREDGGLVFPKVSMLIINDTSDENIWMEENINGDYYDDGLKSEEARDVVIDLLVDDRFSRGEVYKCYFGIDDGAVAPFYAKLSTDMKILIE